MTNTKFSIADDNLNTIASNQKRIKVLKDDAKEANGEAQTLKLGNYCQLISGIASIKLTSKYNLPSGLPAAIRGELMDFAGLSESMANKMIKNAVGARNVFGIGGDNITPEMVASTLEANDITSEAKLIKAVSGDDTKSKVQLAVEKVAGKRSTKKGEGGKRVAGKKWIGGFNYAEIEEFQELLADALRNRAKMEDAAEEAGNKSEEENQAVRDMTDQLKGQAA